MTTLRLNSPASLAASPGDGAETRRVTEDGTDWLVSPAVAVQEDVYRYPAPTGSGITREFLPADELQATTNAWSGKPLLLDHPENPEGEPTVIANGDAVDPTEIGEVRSPVVEDGKLKAETWINLSEQGRHDGALIEIVNALEAGRVVETSTGYLADRDPADDRVNQAPTSADAVQTDLRPDHLAVFPVDGETGNCSVAEGCGVGRANIDSDMTDAERVAVDDEQAATLGRRVLNALGVGGDLDATADGGTTADDAADCSCDDSDVTTNANEAPADDGDDVAAGEPDPDPESDSDLDSETADDTDSDTDSSMTDSDSTETETDESAEGADDDEAPDADTEQPETDPDPTPEPDADGGADDVDLTDVMSEIDALREENQELREQIEAPQREAQQEAAEVVANEFGVDPEDVDLDTEAAQAVLNDHREPDQTAAPAANMAAVPGQVERANSDDSEDVPAAGFSNWESRTNDNGGDN